MKPTPILRWCLCGLVGMVSLAPSGAIAAGFALTEYLHRAWSNECVTFPLDAAARGHVAKQHALVGPGGRAVPYQVMPPEDGRPERIAFLVDLAPFASAEYTFAESAAATDTDLVVEETADAFRLSNGLTGIALAKAPAAGQGPVSAVRLASGAWCGGSRVSTPFAADGYRVEITARGPVFLEAVCTMRWAADETWRFRVRVFAHEPVVLIDETCHLVRTPQLFSLLLSPGFAPDTLLYRTGKGRIGQNKAWPIEPGSVGILEPWLHWSETERQFPSLALVRTDKNDLLMLGARMAGEWVDLAIPAEHRMRPRGEIVSDAQGVHLDFAVKQGRRAWMLTALPAAPSLACAADPKTAFQAPPYYDYLIKHGHFPLDLIKDYVLDWDTGKQAYPHLVYTQRDVENLRRRAADPAPYTAAIPSYLRDQNPLGQFNMEGPITSYFVTQDPVLARHLADGALRAIQGGVDEFFHQDTVPFGCAPHHQQIIGVAMLLADAILASDVIRPEERRRLLAQAAFLGYTADRPEFWSPERGFSANPNMTTSARGYLATAACFLPTHPRAKAWLKTGMADLRHQLHDWSDANGGWLEAPHYAMVSFDQILGVFLMARNAGFGDELFDPKFQAIARWFGKISTPPDSRFGGFRHLPPLGNTYMMEPTGEFGILAYLWREKDPAFSAEMQWLHQQHKSFPTPGIGGGYPAFAGYRKLLSDATLPATPPAYRSELFPETGVVLRNTFPSDRETWLHMIAGTNHAHYDQDSGSITLYGKGRILAEDFGYYACAPPDDHSMVESPAAMNNGSMAVRDFRASERFDYVAGVSGGWTRQIAFVKGPDALAPAYFVIRDTMAAPAPLTWRLWLTASRVTIDGMHAVAEGKEDADLDIFVLQPAGTVLRTEEKTRTSVCGTAPDGRQGPLASTQIGLICQPAARITEVVAVLVPRLKSEKAPTVTPLADGRVVRVETAAGVDYVFLARTPFAFKDAEVDFSGVAGCAQLRGQAAPVLALGAAGTISARGASAKSDHASGLGAFVPFPNGDFEDGTIAPFPEVNAKDPGATVETSLHEGNPAPRGALSGTHCLAIRKLAEGTTSVSVPHPIFLDPSRCYQVSARVYTAAKLQAEFGGYGSDGVDRNLKDAAGNVWQYGFWAKGPLAEWTTLATSIGPAGAGMKLDWPAGFLSTHLVLWLNGAAGTLYVDDVRFELLQTR